MKPTDWNNPPAGIGGTWYLVIDPKTGRPHVVGQAMLAEFTPTGVALESGTFDEMMELARQHNRAQVAEGGAA